MIDGVSFKCIEYIDSGVGPWNAFTVVGGNLSNKASLLSLKYIFLSAEPVAVISVLFTD